MRYHRPRTKPAIFTDIALQFSVEFESAAAVYGFALLTSSGLLQFSVEFEAPADKVFEVMSQPRTSLSALQFSVEFEL